MASDQPSDACLVDLGLEVGETLYQRPLARTEDLRDWRLEGPGAMSFPLGRLRLESTAPPEDGQRANLVLWCPETFPGDIRISWDFRPLYEPGLAILFLAGRGRDGSHILAEHLAPRTGPYDQYHHGDIDALHVSYFRRRNPDEIALHTCNLRKSHGFHLVCQGADPIPSVAQASGPYRIAVITSGATVRFCIGSLTIFTWQDPGDAYGPVLDGGSIGFRQMNPLIAEYADLRVERLHRR